MSILSRGMSGPVWCVRSSRSRNLLGRHEQIPRYGKGQCAVMNSGCSMRYHPCAPANSAGTDQGLRKHALLVVLLGWEPRVSKGLGLRRVQYTGTGGAKVRIKGRHIRDNVPVQRDAREVLDTYRRRFPEKIVL